MSHTNQTTNYHLPQFIGTDKPAWLVDFNQSMADIDTQMKANETASATAEANAQSALSGVSALNSQVGGLQTDVTAIQTQMPLDEAQITTNAQNISTQASAIVNANNRIDTLNGKVGDLADLDTTDKTSVVNAVNELKENIADLSALHELAKTLYNNVTVAIVGEVSELASGSAFFNYPLLAKPDNVTVSAVEFPADVVVTTFDSVSTSDNYLRIDSASVFASRKKQACVLRCTFEYN